MASRLYTAFGQGKGSLTTSLQAFSFSRCGRPDLEDGDKIILPSELFRAVSRLRLPLPFLFKLSKGTKPAHAMPTRTGKAPPPFEQYCGVMEFSADKGKCFLPKWMLRNLRTREGGSIVLTSQRGVKKGQWAKLQPHTMAFVDLAAAVGPREVLEVAFRNYSALSVGETLKVSVAGESFLIDVIEVKPPEDNVVCLYGDLDLEATTAP
ncbi:hypothetical protein FNF29_02103 [Cafeteria roenbergensis]|uniref:Uncharacterized protein n=1 Tax=Cafeteria roenbergensis TaxID=33653 RepID=A0A5A8CQJ3_CAFRO|nr:hypothetical protein FNF29_02103 [Cafeteria roenbergensis]|eukprot:KAA0154959.1 hypothetical protein FNF29_02103 [Cafeteria roenbergensis]